MAAIGKSTFPISAATGVCRATGRPLAVGETYIATLVEPEGSDDLLREDYSLEAWNEGHRPSGDRRLFGFWRTVVPEPDAAPKILADDDSLLDLFDQLEGENEPKRVAFRFVLTLLLIRRRLIVAEGSRRGMMLVRHKGVERPPKGPPFLEVIDPGLDEATIASVVEQMRLLTGDEPQPQGAGVS